MTTAFMDSIVILCVLSVISVVDTTFTRMNVKRIVMKVKNIIHLADWLRIPPKIRVRQFSSVAQRVKVYINHFMDHDPIASWRSVIVVLDAVKEKEVADIIRDLAEPITGRVRKSVGNMERVCLA